MSSLENRIKTFDYLGKIFLAVANKDKNLIDKKLVPYYEALDTAVKNEYLSNGWFIEKFIRYQLFALGSQLNEDNLKKWLLPYQDKIKNLKPKKVGVIFAGNIPLVGFMDMLDVLISGHKLIAKLSSKDKNLPKIVAEILFDLDENFRKNLFLTEDKLTDYEAIIATGSNNSARYFEYYFSKVPNIIRKNKNSVAIITNETSDEDLEKLADDILLFFGLGCRNVSKIYIPENFDLDRIFKAIYKYSFVLENTKYSNNYIYNRTIFLMNKVEFWENGFFILKEDLSLASPVAVLHFERYSNKNSIPKRLKAIEDQIQIVVAKEKISEFKTIDFGKSQIVKLDDYADGVNVMEFLTNI